MSTRISSSGVHTAAIAQLIKQQVALSRTQAQVASGKRFQSPAEDPIAAARVLDLEGSKAQLEQYAKNSNILQSRLNIGEQTMADAGNILQRVRELALQANSGSLDATARSSLAAEIRARSQELLDLGNRRDANGEYLFAGFSTGTQPFARGAAGVTYAADQGVRSLQIGPDQRVADSFNGVEVFMAIPEGNGTFVTAQGTHTGTGTIDTGQVTNAAAWVADTYTVSFTTASTFEVRDSANVLVTSGTYTDGNTIAFNGVTVTVTGAPAAGDTFTVAPATRKSAFDTLDDLAAALIAGGSDPVSRSTLNTNVNSALTQIDQVLNQFIDLRSELGARLSTVDNADENRAQVTEQLQGSLSELQDLDFAEAISRMNQQLTGLQAAQAAYARIAQLSLFNYL
jgi:flagellar hook-associated protein 3 FlgL